MRPLGIDATGSVSEIPTAVVSVDNRYHLQDVPRFEAFVIGHTAGEYVVEGLVDKLLDKSPFKRPRSGKS